MRIFILMIILLLLFSCTEKTNKLVPPEGSVFQVQAVEPIILGGVKYKRHIVSGLNRAFDVIRHSSGAILILQLEPRKILEFNSKYEFIKWIGLKKNGAFTTEWETPETYFGESLPKESLYSEPHSFVVDSRNSKIISVVYYGRVNNQNANTVSRYDLDKGNFLSSFGMINETEFSNGFTSDPKVSKGNVFFQGIVNGLYDSSNNFYISDYANCSLSKFDSSYRFQGWIGLKNNNELTDGWSLDGSPVCTSIPGGFDRLHGIAFDSKGNFYVADTWNHRIQKFNSVGKFVGWLGVREDGKTTNGWEKTGKAIQSNLLGGFNMPIAIKIDNEDNIYLLELLGNRLQKMTSEGKSIWDITDLKESFGLQVYDNEFIISDTGNQRVIIFTKE